MTLFNVVITVILDILIIVLAIKTKIYANILKTVKKTIQYITMPFIIFFPFCLFALLIVIYNAICSTTPIETANIIIVNEYNRLEDLKQFGIDCIRYSPMFYLVMCFLLQSVHYKNEEIANNNANWLKTVLLKFKVSIIINNITILICMVFFFINFSFYNIYSENSFRMILIISTGILFYFCIFHISATFFDGIINYKNETTENTRIRKIKYLVYLPFINICLIDILNKEIYDKNRKNSI